ncbi:DUF1161 domain-containing protein [Tatumella sp. JGM118]|mgnify:CR=1 FL=1|uniref:DUF1161 domain-containing protein n=1 Tax=Tatumella sp. JGM118 TaxID=2799796 RepID=UPI001BB06107|nr:DUF1161 domain-containing protein [Tatumella sp. JGM118]MBS0908667.1 DUF1161 domain-containing protein [Tatumella sp. JGM118]
MKRKILWAGALLFACPLLAQASCESVKADISKKIIANGVPESGFSLDIVPSDQADQQGGVVVGHCQNDSQKLVYKRLSDSNSPSSAG